MKKAITLLCLLVGLAAFSQSNITNILNEPCQQGIQCSIFTIGCCFDDEAGTTADYNELLEIFPEGADMTHYTSCYFPDFQEYYVTEDIYLTREINVFRNCRVVFRNGANIFLQGNQLHFTCDGSFDFTSGGGIFESPAQMNQTLSIKFFELTKSVPMGLPYDIIDTAGRIINKGVTDKNTKDLRSVDQPLLLRIKGYAASRIPYPNN